MAGRLELAQPAPQVDAPSGAGETRARPFAASRKEPVVRRSLAVKLAVCALLCAAASLPANAGATAPRCEAKEGDTLTRSTTTRVFQRVRGTVDNGQTVSIYSCRIGTRGVVRVERFRNTLDGSQRVDEAVLGSSRWVVLVLDEETGTSDAMDLFEYDLSMSDRRVFTFSRDGTREGAQVVVTRSGGIGLLDDGAVRVFDAAGARVAAPSGASDLGRGLGGNTVYWTAAGTPQSTLLTGHPSGD